MDTRDTETQPSTAAAPAAVPARADAPEASGGEAEAPRLVIRGESSSQDGGERVETRLSKSGKSRLIVVPQPMGEGHPYAALTDYLNVTFPLEYSESWVATFLTWVTGFLGRGLGGLAERNRGLHGYKRSFAFDNGGALLAFGGQAGTAFLSLPGEACALVPDWQDAAFFFEKVLEARITRWDGAADDFEGTHSVDEAVSEYLSGGFNAGGNRPSCSQAGNWIAPDGKGRTFYVGRRENGKLMRIYEKG